MEMVKQKQRSEVVKIIVENKDGKVSLDQLRVYITQNVGFFFEGMACL